jgi:acetylornithine/N-succinyldiaminopimelate aminotransferase
LMQEGIIINRTHETVLRFLPPYVIQKEHVDQVVKALDAALKDHEEGTENGEGEKKVARPRRQENHAHA